MAQRQQRTSQRQYAPEAVFESFLYAAVRSGEREIVDSSLFKAFQQLTESKDHQKEMYYFNFINGMGAPYCPAIARCILHFANDLRMIEPASSEPRRLRFAEGARSPESPADKALKNLGERLYKEYLSAERKAQ